MNHDLSPADKAELVLGYARHTMGSELFHRHATGLIYTDGIMYLAEHLGAWWLVDAIASHQPSVRRKLKRRQSRDFQVWRLRSVPRHFKGDRYVHDEWILDAWSDIPGESTKLAEQRIEFSDFPVELSPFEVWVEDGTLMLKEER